MTNKKQIQTKASNLVVAKREVKGGKKNVQKKEKSGISNS